MGFCFQVDDCLRVILKGEVSTNSQKLERNPPTQARLPLAYRGLAYIPGKLLTDWLV